MANKFIVEAHVHMRFPPNGYRVKVGIPELGIYINGMVVFSPNSKHAKWSVFTPQITTNGGGKLRPIEFSKKNELWQCIEDACISAVNDYEDVGGSEENVLLNGSEQDKEKLLKDLPF